MTYEEAAELLSGCVRDELRDHAFGDAEVYWLHNGLEVGFGYFGKEAEVSIWGCGPNLPIAGTDPPVSCPLSTAMHFTGSEALKLWKCGSRVVISRNDETGPDEFVAGKTMESLTLGGVLDELTTKYGD